jgi:hypothetical protein
MKIEVDNVVIGTYSSYDMVGVFSEGNSIEELFENGYTSVVDHDGGEVMLVDLIELDSKSSVQAWKIIEQEYLGGR